MAPAWQLATALVAFDVGDFNGDGLTDMVYSKPSGPFGNETKILLNSGQGLVAGGTLTNVYFTAIRAVDMNGDGVDEIVGQGPGYFGLSLHGVSSVPPTVGPAIQSWPTSSLLPGGAAYDNPAPGYETVYDFDGDGDRDLLVRDASQPALLMNDGVGGMVLVGGRTAGAGAMARPLVGDLDADGDPDLLGFAQAGAAIVTGTNAGDGFFAPGATATITLPTNPYYYSYYYSLHAFDRDGDGDSDVYAARNSVAAYGNPHDIVFDRVGGAFVQSAIVTGTGDTSVFKTADFDADGDQDVILGRRGVLTVNGNGNGVTNPMVLLVNNGAAGLGTPVPLGSNHATWDLEIGDFDGNGTPDVFQANNDVTGMSLDPCAVYLFAPNLTYTVVSLPFSALLTASGDLNGDGLTDVIADGQILFAAGGGTFTPGIPLPSALAATATLADVDLDGDLDVFQSPATVMLNAGGGIFGTPNSYLPLNTYPQADLPQPQLVDVDRDGDLDAVWGGPLILLNTMHQIARGSVARPGRPASIDLYGTPSGAWLLFGSNGTASIPLPPWGTAFIDPASAQLGAMNTFTPGGTAGVSALVPQQPRARRLDDLLAGGSTSPRCGSRTGSRSPSWGIDPMRASPIVVIVIVTTLVGHAQTQLFQALDGPLPLSATTATTLGDLDNDGDQDLVGLDAAFLNDGHGRFNAVPASGLNFPRYRSVLVDLNADGFLDMVSTTYGGPVRVDLGGPGITFAPSPFPLPALTPGLSIHNCTVGDVDLDGDADILVALMASTFMAAPPVLWLNDGAGSFSLAPAGSLPVLNLYGTHLFLRDVDADGDLDAIFASNSNPPRSWS